MTIANSLAWARGAAWGSLAPAETASAHLEGDGTDELVTRDRSGQGWPHVEQAARLQHESLQLRGI